MSDAIETTAAGATRVLFGILAFILLMVGIEGVTSAIQLPPGLWPLLLLLGGGLRLCGLFLGKRQKGS